MPRRKPLPDHSLKASDWKTAFSEEQSREIAETYGFTHDYNLWLELNEIFNSYKSLTLSKNNAGSSREQTEILETLHSRSASLLECLRKLGTYERALILNENYIEDLGQAENIVQSIEASALSAIKHLPDDEGGRPQDTAYWHLLANLYRVYTRGTGKTDKISKGDEYSGPFFNFAQTCLEIIGITKSNVALGKAIQRVLSKMDKTSVNNH